MNKSSNTGSDHVRVPKGFIPQPQIRPGLLIETMAVGLRMAESPDSVQIEMASKRRMLWRSLRTRSTLMKIVPWF